MTDNELKDLVASVAEQQKITAREVASLAAQQKEMNRQIGDLHRKWGTFTEGLLLPSIERVLENHFGLTTIGANVRARKNGEEMELDALGYANGSINTAVIVEVKSHLKSSGIAQIGHLATDFAKFFPEHNDKKLYIIVAAINAPKNLRNELRKAGIYFAATDENLLDLKIEENFTPKDFSIK